MLEGENILIKKAQKGDEAAFAALYDAFMPQMYRYVFLKVSNRQEAEDLTHDMFVSAWENIGSYKPKGYSFATWLYHISRNKVIDFYRTHRNHLDIEEVDESAFVSSEKVDELVDLSLEYGKVREAMNGLNPSYQDVLILRFAEDMSHQEIGKVMDKSEGAVRLMQHRALQSLKEIIRQSKEKEPPTLV